MDRQLRYGMVGGSKDGLIGEPHRKAIQLDNKARIVAGCFSRNYEKTLELGRELYLEEDRCYRTWQEMAEREKDREDRIDFVVIVTPNHTHFEICKAFLELGIHVVCDKPVTVTAAQAEELNRLAEEKGLLFMVTYTYMGNVTAKQARAMVARGEIGEIRTVMAEYAQGWLALEEGGGKRDPWRCDPERSGPTNSLGDIGTHVENAVATMTGLKIKRVLAKLDTMFPGRKLDDNDQVLVEYEGGATGMYWVSQIAIGHYNGLRVRIYGTKGTIQWFQENPDYLTVSREDGVSYELRKGHKALYPEANRYARMSGGHPEGWLEAMANLYDSFLECVEAKEDGTFREEMIDYPTIADGAAGIHFVEACLQSSREGNVWVEVKQQK